VTSFDAMHFTESKAKAGSLPFGCFLAVRLWAKRFCHGVGIKIMRG